MDLSWVNVAMLHVGGIRDSAVLSSSNYPSFNQQELQRNVLAPYDPCPLNIYDECAQGAMLSPQASIV